MAFKMKGFTPFTQKELSEEKTQNWVEESGNFLGKASEYLQKRADFTSDLSNMFSTVKEKTSASDTDIKSLLESNPNMTSSQLIKILLKFILQLPASTSVKLPTLKLSLFTKVEAVVWLHQDLAKPCCRLVVVLLLSATTAILPAVVLPAILSKTSLLVILYSSYLQQSQY